jgi:hypothetical protein
LSFQKKRDKTKIGKIASIMVASIFEGQDTSKKGYNSTLVVCVRPFEDFIIRGLQRLSSLEYDIVIHSALGGVNLKVAAATLDFAIFHAVIDTAAEKKKNHKREVSLVCG